MFTGIVEAIGRVERVQRRNGVARVELRVPATWRVTRGDSVAVDGVCLTAVTARAHRVVFEAIPQTLRVTTLGRLSSGDRVNLERALRLSGRMSGHLVTGHIDSVGTIVGRRSARGEAILEIQLPLRSRRLVLPKGSIAIDGISLTVGAVQGDRCRVYVVPQTQRRTTLADKPVGSRVNLEFDLIGKYVHRLLSTSVSHHR